MTHGHDNHSEDAEGLPTSGPAMVERIRAALGEAFENEVRSHLRTGRPAPHDRLHDYLTGVADQSEPRVHLLFDLVEDGTLDLRGDLADVPGTCFFLGDAARYRRSLADWARLLGPSRRYPRHPGDLDELELWSAGDLIWRSSREAAQASRDYLTVLVGSPVALLRARVRTDELVVLAVDEWSGRDAHRLAVAPGLLTPDVVAPGRDLPFATPLDPHSPVLGR